MNHHKMHFIGKGANIMKKQNLLGNEQGFTLVEIIAVLIILGILAAVAVPRYIDLESNAKQRAIDAGISELNGRESLTWADMKISAAGYDATGCPAACAGDATIAGIGTIYDLGTDYTWPGAHTQDGGALSFKTGTAITLVRSRSTDKQPAVWKRLNP